MLNNLLEYLENKKILILGVGLEGKSTYNFLRRYFPDKKLFIADMDVNLLERYPEFLEDINLEISMGAQYLNGIDEYDIIIKTPGISFKAIDISNFENKITNQLELFLKFIDCITIGVTGTKGKSTTSSLIYQILKDQGKDSFLIGNIGDPIFNNIENIQKNSFVVIELSSHELQFVKHSPHIAILLNIYEEHLDFYKSFEEYANSKFNIAKYQNQNDYFIYNYDNKIMKKFNYRINDYAVTLNSRIDKNNVIYIQNDKIFYNDEFIMNINEKMNLKGMHNINNIMFAFGVCIILKLDLNKAVRSVSSFMPLEHRLEYAGKYNEIEYFNDSIATIPEATINDIKALEKVNTLIVGGKDRGVNLNDLIVFLSKSNIENIICLPKTGEYIYSALKEICDKNLYTVSNMNEAVDIAKKVTKKNTICLLSPAASSYGYFKNFRERGEIFKKLIQE